jgi:branched-chain amino acid transport system ATP-binding protein
MPLLEVKEVSRHFGGLTAVDKVTLNVEEGEILGIIGPNGAGKTTLFNLLSGFLKLSHGEIIYQGKSINGLKPHAIAKKGIIRTFQQNNVYRGETVLANVMLACRLQDHVGFWGTMFNVSRYKREEEDKKEKAEKIINDIGLRENIHNLARNLSHGQQRLLGIAMALACKPKLLLLDEPVSGLSLEEMHAIMEKIKEIKKWGITILLVEHEMRMVMNVCERLIVLTFGKKTAEGTPEQIKRNEKVIEAYLGAEQS